MFYEYCVSWDNKLNNRELLVLFPMNYRLSILFLLMVLCGLSACNKQNYIVPNPPTHPPALDVINATSDTLDYFINGTRQNNTSDIYPNGATNYAYVLFGTGSYSFKKAGLPAVLFKQSITLDTAKLYSLFICGTTASQTFLNTDDFSPVVAIDTTSGMAAIRFVNASPNAGTINFVVTTGSKNTINKTGCAFQYVSPFTALKDTVSDVKVYSASTSALLKDTTISLISGQNYTLFSKGTPNSNGANAFGLVLITNPVTISQ